MLEADTNEEENMDRYEEKRERMVATQLIPRGIIVEKVLLAMRTVPRELFVDSGFADQAYTDQPLPIEEEQTISQPYVVALMAQALELHAESRVLEIGSGSGYAAAVMSRIAATVYAVERHPSLARLAQERCRNLGYNNVRIVCADGTHGWPEHAPYDAISVAAGSPAVPQALLAQLKVGGCLIMPVGEQSNQRLLRIRQTSPLEYEQEDPGQVAFVPLVSKNQGL